MIAVHVVREDNRALYEELLDRQFRLRHDIFIDELGWKHMRPEDGRERDQFDTDDTVYLLVTDGDELVGGGRMHPSLAPTLMSEIYPQLAAIRGLQRGPDIMEMTRAWVVASRREERPRRVAGAWKAANLEYALSEGIRALNGVAESWFMPRLTALRWEPRFLGLPEDIDGYNLVAFQSEVTTAALAATRAHYGFEGPVTVWNGITPSSYEALLPRPVLVAEAQNAA